MKEREGSKRQFLFFSFFFLKAAYIFSGSNDKTIKIWDTKDFTCKVTLSEHDGWIRSLLVRGKHLYSGSYDTSVRVWNLESLECEKVITGPKRIESCGYWNGLLFTGADDARVKCYRIGVWDNLTQLKEHNLAVASMAGSKNYFFTGSYDSSIRVMGAKM